VRVRIKISLRAEELEVLDAAAGAAGMSRSDFIARLLSCGLGDRGLLRNVVGSRPLILRVLAELVKHGYYVDEEADEAQAEAAKVVHEGNL
jgi:metal-responsive CopG/Arc/MetJ family transcriptional regulator